MIEFRNLSVGFSQLSILDNLDGQLEAGQLIALMGVNGMGKSCLIKTLTGLIRPIRGEILLNGREIDLYSGRELSQKLSLVLTDRINIDYLGVEELLALGRSPYTGFGGHLRPTDKEIINEISTLLNIDSLRDKLFGELSDGQKQRVLMARAFIQGPEYLFLDEPTTFLDIPSKLDLMECLKAMAQEKKIGIVFSTHDLDLVKDKVNLIWLIDNQGKLQQGSPKDLASSGLLVKNFNL